MSKLEHQMREDRRLRDTARALLRTEFDYAKRSIAPAALGERLGEAVGDRIAAAGERIGELTERHGRKAATVGVAAVGLAGLWLARRPIMEGLSAVLGKCRESFNRGRNRNEEAHDE